MIQFLPACCADKKLEVEGSGEDQKVSVYNVSSSMTAPLKSDVRIHNNLLLREQRMKVIYKVCK